MSKVQSQFDSCHYRLFIHADCAMVFSVEEEHMMSIIGNGNLKLRMGTPSLRIIYEESGPFGYPTLLSKVYSGEIKLSLNEQLIFIADRLHFLLGRSWAPDYEEVVHLMDHFLKNDEDTAMFVLFLPIINKLYKIMAGADQDHVFINYVSGLLRMQYLSLWWRDCEDMKKNAHRQMLLPLSVRWDFEMARKKALNLFEESMSKGDPFSRHNHPLVVLAESAFCAAVIEDVKYFYYFHEAALNATNASQGKNYLYNEITRSLACTNDRAAISSLISALFDEIEYENHRQYRSITAKQYISVLGDNVLSMNSMLHYLLKEENAAYKLQKAGLLRAYLTAMTNFCYVSECLRQISDLHSSGSVIEEKIQEIYTEYSDMVFRRISQMQPVIEQITALMARNA